MTVDSLKDCNKKVLARLAKEQGIVGWHAMRKDQLIRALTPPALSLDKIPVKPTPEKAMATAPSKRPVPALPVGSGRPDVHHRGPWTTPASRTGSSRWSATRTGSTFTGS